jgi:glycosyltransferase involved in cell wall biosynthesis
MKLSFVHLTYRQGGFDILADSLVNQTYKNFELIIVDDFKPDRSQVIREYLEGRGLQIKYLGPSKKKCFPENSFGIFNAINTGFIESTGDVTIGATDYQWYAPDFFEKIIYHEDKLRDNTCIVLPARTWRSNLPRYNSGLISVWKPEWKGNPLMNGCKEESPWVPEDLEFACTVYPMNLIERMNGFPEYLDAVSAQPLEPIMEAFRSVNYKAYVDINNFMFALNHREWLPSELWYQSARKTSSSTLLIKRPNTFNLKELRSKK